MPPPVTDPAQMIQRVCEATVAKDYPALVSFYEPEAVLVRKDGSQARGLKEIEAEYRSYADRVTAMTGRAVWCHIAGDIALVRGEFTITVERRRGGSVTIKGNPMEVLRQQPDGTWKYRIDYGYGGNAPPE